MNEPPQNVRSFTALIDVLVTECRATGEKDDDEGGGGILVQRGAVLVMSGGSIRDCAAHSHGGGLSVWDSASQVRLSGLALQGCTATSSYGCMHIKDGDVSLVDVSFDECGVEKMCSSAYAIRQFSGTLRAERVRVGRPNPKYVVPEGCPIAAVILGGNSEWSDSTISDIPGRGMDVEMGTHALVRTSIVRVRPISNFGFPGLDVRGEGTLTVTDSRIADCGSGCVTSQGTMVLRNTTLQNCREQQRERGYIDITGVAAINFQAELLTFELSCEEDPSAELIRIGQQELVNSAFTTPLKVRGLRIVALAACSSTNFSVVSAHIRPVSCSDDDYAPCDDDATCTEVPPLPTVPTMLKIAHCSCEGVTFPNLAATSPALAPYGFDPSTIGLPDKRVDYCVRPSTVTPQCGTDPSHASPPTAARRSRSVLHARPTSVASFRRRWSDFPRQRGPIIRILSASSLAWMAATSPMRRGRSTPPLYPFGCLQVASRASSARQTRRARSCSRPTRRGCPSASSVPTRPH